MALRSRSDGGGDGGLLAQVRSILLSRLDEGRPSVKQVALEIRVGPRTLQRKLRARGTSFRRLLAATYRMQAARELVNPSLTVAEVASRLGFSDPGNFSRAFRRWTGTSPGAFRRTILGVEFVREGSHSRQVDRGFNH